jgi:hypothetical protein
MPHVKPTSENKSFKERSRERKRLKEQQQSK